MGGLIDRRCLRRVVFKDGNLTTSCQDRSGDGCDNAETLSMETEIAMPSSFNLILYALYAFTARSTPIWDIFTLSKGGGGGGGHVNEPRNPSFRWWH